MICIVSQISRREQERDPVPTHRSPQGTRLAKDRRLTLAIFDLDNTLLAGDSDYLWGQFLVEQGLVDPVVHASQNERFYEQYRAGTLDIHEFLAFQLAPLARLEMDQLKTLRRRFMAQKIRPIVLEAGRSLIDTHRQRGHRPIIITATNRFITAPIAVELGIEHLIATEPELIDGRYTGRVAGVPCYRQGKVTRLEQWMREQGETWVDSWFYTDSSNDLPLLHLVAHAVAVDPDPALAAEARARGWETISLRDPRDRPAAQAS